MPRSPSLPILQNRLCITMLNLKPVKMRGIVSHVRTPRPPGNNRTLISEPDLEPLLGGLATTTSKPWT